MKRIVDNICRLKKYFKLMSFYKEIPKTEILSGNESLKSFGKLWNEYQGDVMTMTALLEYEFISGTNYSDEQVVAVKHVLARMVKFLKGCGEEWKDYELTQIKQKDT